MNNIPIVLREATKNDVNYIIKSWLMLYRNNNAFVKQKISKSVYFYEQERKIKKILNSNNTMTLIATPEEHPNQILGFISASILPSSTIYHFIAVKDLVRGYGIGKKLYEAIPKRDSLFYTHFTQSIANKAEQLGIIFNPYIEE